jgi:hypothetical protein
MSAGFQGLGEIGPVAARLEAELVQRLRERRRWIELEPDLLLWPTGGGKMLVIRIV